MSAPRYLTKTRFKLAVQCPTKLFYVNKPDLYRNAMDEDSFLAMLAEGGYQVGELAKLMYPQGIEVAHAEHGAALAQTAELLQQDEVVIFEAAFLWSELFVRVDILIKSGHTLELIEVKAKSYNSTRPEMVGARGSIKSEMRPYIEDVAFQTYVLKKAMPQMKVKGFLMMPDKSVVCDINGINQWFPIERSGGRSKVRVAPEARSISPVPVLLAKVSVDDLIEQVFREGVKTPVGLRPLDKSAQSWSEAYAQDQKIKPIPGAQCENCEFKTGHGDNLLSGFKECWTQTYQFTDEDFLKGTVLDVWNFRKKGELIAQNRVRLNAVRQDELGAFSDGPELSTAERRWMQIDGIPLDEDRGGYWMADGVMRQAMSQWRYPLHFIDFETSAVALPFHSGMKPYEQVAFQFSHHVMQANGSVRHQTQFLIAEPGTFPNFDFIRALRDALCDDDGTVFMWSSHENTILQKISEQLESRNDRPLDAQALRDFALSLTRDGSRAMVDLCDLAKKAYFHKDTKGSSSIKKVLPAVLSSSPGLRARYSQPIYGDPAVIPSLNYRHFAWCLQSGTETNIDPYDRLRDLGAQLIGEEIRSGEDPDDLAISEGGAAATAYARLQFESLPMKTRKTLERALLRYCELDTLAMVMVVQGWQEALEKD
jgi:Domain of unknown function(DUF2779)